MGTVCREFAAFAEHRGLPFCCVRGGPETKVTRAGSMTTVELKRGVTFAVDKEVRCDPFFARHRYWAMEQVEAFRPDLIQIVGPSDIGVLGFWVSKHLGVPMVGSWHTNLHEYACRRIRKVLRATPPAVRDRAADTAERLGLRALMVLYRRSHFLVAPNRTMVDFLRERTGRPTYLMKHGVDTARFSLRQKPADREFCIGWVGRLTPEKNVRAFAEIERRLLAAGERDFRLLLVGDGSEREWLRGHLQRAAFPGFLHGQELDAAFARMDAFVFPSRTDTFGLVILEAMASGVPVVLSPEAGACIGIRHGVEGFCSDDLAEGVLSLMRSRDLRQSMGAAAQRFTRKHTWDGVFEDLYETYDTAFQNPEVRCYQRVGSRPRPAPAPQ